MITLQTLVDNAIEANIETYKHEAEQYYILRKIADESKTKKDIKEFKGLAHSRLSAFYSIECTLVRIFPDFEDYINDKLVKARLSVKN